MTASTNFRAFSVQHGRSKLCSGTAALALATFLVATPAIANTSAALAQPFSAPLLAFSKTSGPGAFAVPEDLTIVPHPMRLASAAPGDVYVKDGDVTTIGDYTPGIQTTSTGNTTIIANSVTTTGQYSNGIDAQGAGTISIEASSVSTTGAFSNGIVASGDGVVSVDAGTVTTTGIVAQGISASGNIVHVSAGTVSSGHATGIAVQASGSNAVADVTVAHGVTTAGAASIGVGVSSSGTVAIHNLGDIKTYGGYIRGLHIGAAGIEAFAGTGVTIDGGGSIETYGSGAQGVLANSAAGDVSVTTGSISTAGNESAGIVALTGDFGLNENGDYYVFAGGGKVSVDSASVYTLGSQSAGIDAQGGSVEIGSSSVRTGGNSSNGITAKAYAGNAVVHNTGSVTTHANASDAGVNSTGIVATATGDVVVDGGGSVSATGSGSSGVIAISTGGSVTVNQGDIRSGQAGVYALVAPTPYAATPSSEPRTITIDVGNVTTLDSGIGAGGIISVDTASASTTSITAGAVATRGDYANGIYAYADLGNISISSGAVTTEGLAADGIAAVGHAIDIEATSVATRGDYAIGVLALSGPGKPFDANVQVGTVNTTGLDARGILVLNSSGSIDIDASAVSTTGDESAAVVADLSDPDGPGHVAITTGTISTAGKDASGITAINSNKYYTGSISVTASGAIGTAGDNSAGIVALANYDASIAVSAKSINTHGGDAYALVAYSNAGHVGVTVGDATTAGEKSIGLFAIGGSGLDIDVNSVTTSGDVSNAVVLRSGAYGLSGSTTLTAGTITTHGAQSAGIDAVAVGSDGKTASNLSLTAGSISTDGIDSPGIVALDDYGAIAINNSSIVTEGAESTGIIAVGSDAVTINAGSVSTAASSVYANAQGSGPLSLTLTGKVASTGGDGIIALSHGGTTNVTIASGGGVTGAGDAIAVQSSGGAVTIANAGTIAAGAGYAIEVSALAPDVATTTGSAGGLVRKLVPAITSGNPATTINNSGTIIGGVNLAGGDDVLTNSGMFVATRDSIFGAGDDQFVNSGSLSFASSKTATSVTFLGLETFRNAGIVDLRNGTAGDTLTLPGGYIGSAGAKLGLDIGANGASDKLVVTGIASGSTSIVLNATPANATLIAKPVTLVQVGAGTTAGAFTVANQDLGFVSFGLAFNAASSSFQLSATAGAAVHRLSRINAGAQAIWHQSADAWSSHLAELRDDDDQPGNRVWGQAYGQTDTSHNHKNGYNLGYRQDYYGGQAGIDLVGKRNEDGNGLMFGVTGGYLSSHLNLSAGPERVRFDTLNLGGYATLRAGPLFVNLLGQYDHYRTNADNSIEHWADAFGGNGYGAQAEVGARLGRDTLFVEPIATLAWQRTDIGTLRALGQALDFGHETGLTGTVGARFGSTFDLQNGAKAVLYAKASYVHEFKGKAGVLFESGGTDEQVAGTRNGDYGKAAVGVNVITTGRLSGFIEGNADVGGDLKGGGGRAGIRFKL